ncbi:precorrin-6y C5,15-methyltransferase (decarboxylating) subunit CbiE [Aureimonas populi]|uniref:Precorrin-6y C5,15-methyltransferase (Decarboxylating) subunit CbiE n=1 Tax=Aureimonas populi TaxID=1701758 RepID=A0ABW5CHW9_9HYPH|nr:precorrin-6y C5,15-methyltransferase (decarboxylating) subunit CbiE [Aureimonas populi]
MPVKDGKAPNATAKWLSLVGIGEDGVEGLGARAREAVAEASFVFGARRHLDLADPLIRGEAVAWPTPFDPALGVVLGLRGRSVCVLASGDPFHYGVGATLARHVSAGEMRAFPAPSAFSLAAARLAWPLQDCETVSLHGRPVDLIRPTLHPGRRVLALTSDGQAPAAIAGLLAESGFEASILHVLEAIGGPDERLTRAAAGEVAGPFHALNVVAVEVRAGPGARILPLTGGLGDDLFEHDGQITKQAVRAMTLAALGPRRGELLWDIGAGSGSISIAWMLAHPSMRAIAVEGRGERAARLSRNACACGVPGLQVVQGHAPAALSGLPAPDAAFIGGGGGEPAVIEAALEALRSGGRLVANAVTLETEAELVRRHASLGGDLSRIELSRAAPVGSMTGWRPAMPVTQWRWVKP